MSNNPAFINPTDTASWRALKAHHKEIQTQTISALFAQDSARFDQFHIEDDSGFLLDYSKNKITKTTIDLLCKLAQDCELEAWRDELFKGNTVNHTEDRAALHTALRSDQKDLATSDFVEETLKSIKKITDTIRSGNKIKNIINIGIGGSDLGPRMACEALTPFKSNINVYFVSNIDAADLEQVIAPLKAEETLFIIASKTFTTLETITNAHNAKTWLSKHLNDDNIKNHLITVTSNTQAAQEFGVKTDHILPLRDWIGGRYSVWSAIGLPIALTYGFDVFKDFLKGAHAMDTHFQSAPLEKNIPTIMALIGIWHRNFCDYESLAILPYAQNLKHFTRYIQQLDMESNGKQIDREGKPVSYNTSPVVFGEPGTNSQHAFFQMLHQGTSITPCDFILSAKSTYSACENQDQLIANALAQSAALMSGKNSPDAPHKQFNGDRPSNTIILPELNAYALGMLMAAYEHKVFVQGIIWNINSFDQWGVELGKTIAKNIAKTIKGETSAYALDASTQGILHHINQQK